MSGDLSRALSALIQVKSQRGAQFASFPLRIVVIRRKDTPAEHTDTHTHTHRRRYLTELLFQLFFGVGRLHTKAHPCPAQPNGFCILSLLHGCCGCCFRFCCHIDGRLWPLCCELSIHGCAPLRVAKRIFHENRILWQFRCFYTFQLFLHL